MIITKTPFRMSFFGGGTDLPEFFNKYQQLEKLNRVIVEEFVDRIYIGKINKETNTRDIEIKWNFE